MKNVVSKEAALILRQVEKAITEVPARLDMGVWGRSYFGDYMAIKHADISVGKAEKMREQLIPPCRTMACIAGHVMLLTEAGREKMTSTGCLVTLPTGELEANFHQYHEYGNSTPKTATKILEITEEQAQNLFYPDGWPEVYDRAMTRAKTAKGRAKVTVERIEHFIKTGR